jgi:hypothetical protein
MLKDIGEKMKKYPGSIAKISQDFNIISTLLNFFLPRWACISANCMDFAILNVMLMSTLLAPLQPLKTTRYKGLLLHSRAEDIQIKYLV